MPIQPARLQFSAEGTPISDAFGDVYHSRDGGLAQARHVFLAGNGLPERWHGRNRFTIIETGFGLGLNFLATWQAWRTDPARPQRLHYVAAELHPFTADDLAHLHAQWPELTTLAQTLREHWPVLTPGFHRVHLDSGQVTLTLLLGDARALLPELQAQADAFYLDGFAPSANPELWSPEILAQVGRLAAEGATVATWSVSGAVRRTLTAAGFICEKTPGFAGKREMLRARLAAPPPLPRPHPARHAIILGAGLAGTCTAHRLAERGWKVNIIDAAPGPAEGASGNLCGVLRPLPSLDDNRLARITRAGTLYATHHLNRLAAADHPVAWAPCGVLHLARDPMHEAKQRQVVTTQIPPEEHLRFVTREEASKIAGWPVPHGGWWFPEGGWISPRSLCAANLQAAADSVQCHFERAIARIEHVDDLWNVIDDHGLIVARAPILILANGVGITRFPEAAALPVRSARGQVTHLPAESDTPPEVVVCRLGYVSPAIDGVRCAGATFAVGDDDATLRLADHRENLAKLAFMLPGYPAPADVERLTGRVGFRPASPDRLPMVGAVPIPAQIPRGTPLGEIARVPGLYAVEGFGARGLVWSALAGELLASLLASDPLPLESDLVQALDPARFLAKPPHRAMRDD